MIETRHVSGRRKLRFSDHQQVLEEVRRLAQSPTRQLGNWTLGQIISHLAIAMEQSALAEKLFTVPLITRIMGRVFLRRAILRGRFPPGIRLPKDAAVLLPAPVDSQAAIAHLERSIALLSQTSRRIAHPVIGRLSPRQWDQLHLRHAELHLSFVLPAPAEGSQEQSC